MIKRYLEDHVRQDIADKMVFISGPRQVGKTTLAKELGRKHFPDSCSYLNWDNRRDRKAILSGEFEAGNRLVIFDEIHKYKNWKNYLKGEYDKYRDKFSIVVTGSARLDLYRRGGDSLLGRYHAYRLHPLSVAELAGNDKSITPHKELIFSGARKEEFKKLFSYGGFPEVCLKHDVRLLRRWHNERTDLLIREDIRDIEAIRDISALQVLVDVLPDKVGSLFSINSLKEDLQVTHKTVASWVDVLEKFYYHYRIYPFQSSRIKSLRKEPKLYLWDWSEIEDEDIRLENLIASHLLKLCHFLHDVEGYDAKLYYIRDKEQREVDFLVCIEKKPWFCVEVKASFRELPVSLKYFSTHLKIPFSYLVIGEEGIDYLKDSIRIISASKFLGTLV
ncbi:MAG: hypothetical protein A3I73_06060 [Omnitrophica bacterium RIFCSPLOWO2_02_FULL_45_16]|nr:MAG: hypothetical protein A3C51_01765 [Omnitrophica bacterium RIFCSPHIGHO2_02_FULL_46_20]OGW94956.1 MAG: hypothetical protein A3K16_02510 [Omnitrophica bacterium RIFCSPLOWO2_01_FULL_45_24]OGX01117.1 MAG: hypothetical protein A3I73_06060 [Omnitrophica bacterium RIFCSPLOWO2_02_FULL_45_16]